MAKAKTFFDVGTYTGNGGLYRVGVPTLRTAYNQQVARSLRFRSGNSAYLSRTFGAGTSTRKFTFSWWQKRTIKNSEDYAFSGNIGAKEVHIGFSSNIVDFYEYNGGTVFRVQSKDVYRDPGLWQHRFVSVDTTQSTAANRVRIYNNGIEISYTSFTTYPSLNYDFVTIGVNSFAGLIGKQSGGGYFDGYMSEVYFIDGQALTPSSFGEYNSDNIWMPKSYSGTYGTNGFYLNFSDNSGATATTIGKDSSGNSNNWTPSGISVTAGTTNDSLTDTPTDYGTDTGAGGEVRGNYCTWNRLMAGSGTLSTIADGNLKASGSGTQAFGTIQIPTTGKWYFEITATTAQYPQVGIGRKNSAGGGAYANNYGTYYNAVNYYVFYDTGNSAVGNIGGICTTTNDVALFCIDATNNKVWMGRSRSGTVTWLGGGDPSTGTSPTFSGSGGGGVYSTAFSISDGYWPYCSNGSGSDVWYINAGQRAFTYTAPSGYKALTTANITAPADASKWFYGGVPDLVWIKDRTSAYSHSLTDTVRGVGLELKSDSTGVEVSGPDISEMNKFGMTLIGDTNYRVNKGLTDNYVYWAWKAGGAAVTNTSGTISSQVSANPTSGFSVVTWTSTGTNGSTIGHGLGVVPNLIISKSRTVASKYWPVYHSSIGNTGAVYLNLTNATDTNAAYWNNTSPTSSVFTVGTVSDINTNGSQNVSYCWAAIPGFSAFGSYTGNNAADGPFVYTGFRPRWILFKDTTTTGAWMIHDTSRDTYNAISNGLAPSNSNAESTYSGLAQADILSNGFKIRATDANQYWNNKSGYTYIYAAFADVPFKYALAR